jgi:hypothetical protein
VTHVLNCAAVASFGNNPLIWKVNVEGTLALAAGWSRSGLQRFLHVGTAMSCTPEQDSLVAESAEFRENAEHLVEYTHSKSTIEQLMRSSAQRCRCSSPVPPSWSAIPITAAAFQQYFLGLQHGADAAKFMCSMEDRSMLSRWITAPMRC